MKYPLDRPGTLYATVFFASLTLSLWAYLQSGIINKDGILYIKVAQSFITGGLTDAFATFNWPTYGVLIALVHQVTRLGLEEAAHLLNGILIATMCAVFVATYREIGRRGTRPWFAGLLILCLPIVNDYRGFVIRDFGYWTFSLLALLYLIKNINSSSISNSARWQTAALFAIAFRIEGIIFIAAPAIYIATTKNSLRGKLGAIFQSSFLFFAFGILSLLLLATYGTALSDKNLTTLSTWMSYVSPGTVINGFLETTAELQAKLKYLSSEEEAALVLASGLISLAVFKIIKNAVFPLVIVAIYGYRRGWFPTSHASAVAKYYFLLACLTTLAILASKYFLSSRYTALPALLLFLITAPYLDIAFQKLRELKRPFWSLMAWTIIAAVFLDGIISTGPTKEPIKTGARWAIDNLDRSRQWVCNESRIRYYTDDQCEYVPTNLLTGKFESSDPTETPKYLLLWIGHKDKTTANLVEQSTELRPVMRFDNRKADGLVIYEVNPPYKATPHQ